VSRRTFFFTLHATTSTRHDKVTFTAPLQDAKIRTNGAFAFCIGQERKKKKKKEEKDKGGTGSVVSRKKLIAFIEKMCPFNSNQDALTLLIS
jgi:hypothetical protein